KPLAHLAGEGSVQFSPDGQYLATVNARDGLRIWQLRSPTGGSSLPRLEPILEPVPGFFAESIVFSPDNRYLSFIREAEEVYHVLCLWPFSTASPPQVVATNLSISRQVQAFTPDSRYLLKTDTDRAVVTFEVASGREVARFETETNRSPAEV